MAPLTPFQEALQKLQSRQAVGAGLSSKEWQDVPIGLRERAFFSARVTNAALAQDMKDRVQKMLNPRTVMRDGRPVTEGLDLASARAELKGILSSTGYDPGETRGTIQDLSSDGRLNLILRHNVDSAQGYGNWLQGQADGVLDEFPAQELFRAEDREVPRDWIERWRGAGGEFYDGRMIALKSDPIWTELSAFGTPWPPFDFNSGMWVRDIDRAEAEALGVLQPGEQVQPTAEEFNAGLEASVRDLDPQIVDSLKSTFGDQVEITAGKAIWNAKPIPVPTPTPAPTPPPRPPPTPTPGPPKKREVPDISDLVSQHAAAAPAERRAIVEQARERLSIPQAERKAVALVIKTRLPQVRATAQAGSDIVSRYTAPELLGKTHINVKANRSRRAHYNPLTRAIVLHRDGSASTGAHEIMHGVEEQNPAVLKAAAEFLLARAPGETPKSLRALTGNPGYKTGEIALKDKWAERNGSVYAGKVYARGLADPSQPQNIQFTEVLTMGVERLHADPVEFATNDREWFDFVVRTLRNL